MIQIPNRPPVRVSNKKGVLVFPSQKKYEFLRIPLLITGISCLVALMTLVYYRMTFGKTISFPPAKEGVARVLDFKGRVLYRNHGDFVFREVTLGQVLPRYTTLFSDGNGDVMLEYAGKKAAAVAVPKDSIYRLEQDLPLSMLMRRGFTRSRADFLEEAISGDVLDKESQILAAGVQDTGEYVEVVDSREAKLKALRFGIRVVMDMKRIQVTFPLTNLFVWRDPALGFAKAPISFGGVLSEPLQAYVWQVKPQTKIVWSGLVSKDSRRLVLSLPESGTYVFQGFGKSGTSRTRSVKIVVNEKTANPEFFPKGLARGDSIIFN
ncbi:MAG: hypothetical protein RI953_2543 [Pseudomonadota bacterium]|jgi:hypothetical protein